MDSICSTQTLNKRSSTLSTTSMSSNPSNININYIQTNKLERPSLGSRTSSVLTTSSASSISSTSSSTKQKRPNFLSRSSVKAVMLSDMCADKMRHSGERLIDWACVGIERLVV